MIQRPITCVLVILIGLSSDLGRSVLADEPAVLKFARREAKKVDERTKLLTAQARQAVVDAAPAEQSVADAQAAKAAAEHSAATAAAAVQDGQQAKAAADQALVDAQNLVRRLEAELLASQRILTVVVIAAKDAEAKLADQVEQKKKADSEKSAAEENLTEKTAAAKPLIDAKLAAENAATHSQQLAQIAIERVAAFEETPPTADPQLIREVMKLKHDCPMWSCRFDDSGNYLFAGAHDNFVHRWDFLADSRTPMEGHRSWVRRFDFHPDGKTLITGAYEGRLIWWNLLSQTPTPQRTIDAHQGYVRAITISPDGQYVVTGGNDNLVKVWSTMDGTLIQELSGHARHVYNVAFHPDGEHIVSGDLMGVLKQWQVGTWSHVRDLDAGVLVGWDKKFQADCGGIRGMDFSPDGKSLAVAGISEVTNAFAGTGKPTVVVFDWETGQRLHVLTPKTNSSGACWGMRWHRSGEFIVGAGGGSTGSLWFWKPNEENSFFDFKTPSVPFDVAFHPDGLRLAVALYDQTVRIYDLGPKLKTETNTETGS